MPINPEAAIYTPQRITAVAEAFAEDGGDIGQLLESTGISVDDLGNPETRVSCQQICSVFRNALQLSPDPTLALRAGSRMHLTSYGMFGYALLSALNFEERNEIVIRYHRMCTPGVRISSMHDEQALRYGYEVVLGGATADGLHRFIIEFGYAAHLSVARDLYGPEFSFSSVGVTYAEPSHAGRCASCSAVPCVLTSSITIWGSMHRSRSGPGGTRTTPPIILPSNTASDSWQRQPRSRVSPRR